MVCFAAICLPFAVFGSIAGGAEIWLRLGMAILVSVAIQFVLVFPFLLLSFTNNFYRERLKQLLLLARPEPPPVLTPTPTPAPAT